METSSAVDAADMLCRGIPTAIYGLANWNTPPNKGIPIAGLVTGAREYAATTIDQTTCLRRK